MSPRDARRNALKTRALELKRKDPDMPVYVIAERLRVDRSTISLWLNAAGLPSSKVPKYDY